jgi:hypothetical protein
MSAMNAYEDEMEDFADFHEQDAAPLVDALRDAYVRAPDRGLRSAHMAAIATEAAPLRLAADARHRSANRLNRHPTRRFRMTPKRLAFLPVAVVLAFLGTAGLAVAGVTLPDAARAPFDAVGLQLPNQSRASDVHAVIDATQPGGRGCAFGQAVAAAASQGHSQAPASACDHGQGDAHSQGAAHSEGAAAHSQGDAHSQGAGGQADATQAPTQGGHPSGVPPAPPAGQEFGQGTSGDAQQSASTDRQAFGDNTAQGAQSLTPATPPAGAGDQGGEASQSGAGQGESAAAGSPGGSHIP